MRISWTNAISATSLGLMICATGGLLHSQALTPDFGKIAQQAVPSPHLVIPSAHTPGLASGVKVLAANPETDWFATLGADQTICIWSALDGHFLAKAPAVGISGVAILSKSHLAIEGNNDGNVRLIDVNTFAVIKTAKLPGPVLWMQSTKDGRVLAATSQVIYQLDPAMLAATPLITLDRGLLPPYVAIDPAGAMIAVAMPGLNDVPGSVMVYDTHDGRALFRTQMPRITSLALDSGRIAIGSKDSNEIGIFTGQVRILRVPSGAIEHTVPLKRIPQSLLFARDDAASSGPTTLIAGFYGGMERISVAEGKVTEARAANGEISQLASAGSQLVAAGTEMEPELCNARSLNCTLAPAVHGVAVTQAKMLADGSLLLMDLKGNSLRIAEDVQINKVLLSPALALIPRFKGISGVFATDGYWVNNALEPVEPADMVPVPNALPVAVSDDGRYLAARSISAPGREINVQVYDLSRIGAEALASPPLAASWKLTGELQYTADASQEFQIRFAPGARLLVAIDTVTGSVHRFDLQIRREILPVLNPPGPQTQYVLGASFVSAWAISADGRQLARAQYHSISGISLDGGAPAGSIPLDGNVQTLVAGKDGAWFLAMEDGSLLRWDGRNAPAPLVKLPYSCDSLFPLPERNWIVANANDGSVQFIDAATGQTRMSLLIFENGRDWFLWTPAGIFDASDQGWQAMQWKFASDTFSASEPVEDFRDDFYFPGLAAQVMAGNAPSPPPFRAKERRTPKVQITASKPSANGKVVLDVTVSAPAGVAIRDVHLSRHGVLLKTWSGEQRNGSRLSLSADIVQGENRFTAYAFNQDDVKSKDAETEVTGPASLKRAGDLYVVAIGIDDYRNPAFHLNYARKDARLAAGVLAEQRKDIATTGRQLQEQGGTDKTTGDVMVPTLNGPSIDLLPSMGDVHVTTLVDAEATRSKILQTIAAVSHQARPEDTLVVFYAGHGVAAGDRYYLLPQDFAFEGDPNGLLNAGLEILEHSAISDEDLQSALAGEQAAVSALILDSCQSGQLVGDKLAQRRGPMNSRGLAQMAYDKGMFILAASLSTQSAEERAALGDGVLTYALMQEGLVDDMASPETVPGLTAKSHGATTLTEWLRWSARRVAQSIDETGHPRGFPVAARKANAASIPVQQPRLFSPPGSGGETIIALGPINFDPQTMTSAGYVQPAPAGAVAGSAVARGKRRPVELLFPASTLGPILPGPVLDGGHRMLAAIGNRIVALDLDHGAVLWRQTASGNVIGFDVSPGGEMAVLDQTGNVSIQSANTAPKIVVRGSGFNANGLVRWIGGRQLLVVTDKSVALYQPDGSKVASTDLPFYGVSSPVLTAADDYLYLCDAFGNIFSYKLPSLSAGPTLRDKSQSPASSSGQFRFVTAIAIDSHTHRLIRIMNDGSFTEVQLPALMPAPQPLVHADRIRAAAFSSDGTELFVADMQGAVQAIRTADGAVTRSWPTALPAIDSLAIDRKSSVLVASGNGGMAVWSLSDGKLLSLVPGGRYFTTASFASSGALEIMLTGNGRVRSLQLPGRGIASSIASPSSVFVSHNRIAGKTATELDIWDPVDLSKAKRFALAGDGRLDLTPDGRYLAWLPGSLPTAEIQVIETGSGKVLKRIPLASPANSFALSDDGKLVAYLVGEQLHLVPVDGKTETSLNLPQAPCCFASISPASDRLLLASQNGRVMLFDLALKRVIRSIAPAYAIVSAAFAPQADQVVLASSDGVVLLWDVSAAAEPHLLGTVEGTPLGIAFNHAGTLALVSTNRGNVGWFSLAAGNGQLASTYWIEQRQSWLTRDIDGRFEIDGDRTMPIGKADEGSETWIPAEEQQGFLTDLLKQLFEK